MGQVLLIDAPDRANILPISRVLDAATARQLRSFLAHLASALSIALPGQGTVTSARAPEIACCQRQVDRCDPVIDALTLVFQSARSVNQSGVGVTKHARGLDDGFRTQTTDSGHPLRRILFNKRPGLFPTSGTLANKILVHQALFDDHMEHPIEQRGIGTRT